MSDGIELSIIIPAYNASATIERAISSAFRLLRGIQGEVIVVDDGSTDGTPQILNQLSAKYRDLRTASQLNSGRSAARNRGVSLARGQWLMFLDADDYLFSDAKPALMEVLDACDVGLVIFPMAVSRSGVVASCEDEADLSPREGVTISAGEVIDGMVSFDAVECEDFKEYTYEFNSPWSRLYRREQVLSLVAKEVPGFEPFPVGLRFSEDRLFNIAYLAMDRRQGVMFARCAPLYCWDMQQSGTVGVVRVDDARDLPLFARLVAGLEKSGIISGAEGDSLIARETINRLKRTTLLESGPDFRRASALWMVVLQEAKISRALSLAGGSMSGVGYTKMWRPMTCTLSRGRYAIALRYCGAYRVFRMMKRRIADSK